MDEKIFLPLADTLENDGVYPAAEARYPAVAGYALDDRAVVSLVVAV